MSNYQSKQTNHSKIMKEVNLKTSKIQKKLFSIKSDLDLTKQYAASAKEISVIDTVINTGNFKTIDGKTNEGLNFLKNKKAAIFYDMLSSGCIESHLWQILQQSQKEYYFTKLKELQKPGHYDPNKKQVGPGSMDGGKHTFDQQIESYEEFLQECCTLADEARKKYEIFDLYALSEGLKKDLDPSSVKQYETNRIKLYQQFSLQHEKWVCKIEKKEGDKLIREQNSFEQSQSEQIKAYLQQDQKFIFCKEMLHKQEMHKQLQQLEALRSPNPDNRASEMFSYDERRCYKIVNYSTKNLNKVNRDYVQKLRMEYLDGKTEVGEDLTKIYEFMVSAYNKLDKSGWLYLFKASENFEGMRGNNITATFGTEKLEKLQKELETKGQNSLYYFFDDLDAFETAAQAEKIRVEKANKEQSSKRQWPVNSFYWLHGNHYYTVGKGVFDLVCWRYFINNWISKYLLENAPGVGSVNVKDKEKDPTKNLQVLTFQQFGKDLDKILKTEVPTQENFKKMSPDDQIVKLGELTNLWQESWKTFMDAFKEEFGDEAYQQYNKENMFAKTKEFDNEIKQLRNNTGNSWSKVASKTEMQKPPLAKDKQAELKNLLAETKQLSQEEMPSVKQVKENNSQDEIDEELDVWREELQILSYKAEEFLKKNNNFLISEYDSNILQTFRRKTTLKLQHLWQFIRKRDMEPIKTYDEIMNDDFVQKFSGEIDQLIETLNNELSKGLSSEQDQLFRKQLKEKQEVLKKIRSSEEEKNNLEDKISTQFDKLNITKKLQQNDQKISPDIYPLFDIDFSEFDPYDKKIHKLVKELENAMKSFGESTLPQEQMQKIKRKLEQKLHEGREKQRERHHAEEVSQDT